jgi:hypothetical protein
MPQQWLIRKNKETTMESIQGLHLTVINRQPITISHQASTHFNKNDKKENKNA